MKQTLLSTRNMVKISILSVLAFLAMFLNFPVLPLFPFLKVDFSDMFAFLGGFSMGPVAGVIIVFFKNVLYFLKGSSSGGIGELSNFIVGSALVFTASAIYIKNKSLKGAIVGGLVGLVVMVAVACLSNYFLILDLYEKVLGVPLSIILGGRDKLNFILAAVVPFNFIKGGAVTLATFLIYKRVSPLLRK